MDDLYRDTILDLYLHPHHAGKVRSLQAGERIEHKHLANASCGDVIDCDLIVDEHDMIVDLFWMGSGCAISQASMSAVSDWVVGKSLNEISDLDQSLVLSFLGMETITPAREKCVLLPLQLTR